MRDKEKQREYSRQYYHRNKEARKEYAKRYRENNKEKVKKAQDNWKENNKEVIREYNKEYSKVYYQKNTEKVKEHKKKWNDNNKDKKNAYTAKRRAKKLNATPSWADLEKIKVLYEKAKWLESLTGLKYHVDHVIPLINDNVCGLHCWHNLQILEESLNIKKSNK
jgi:hypothetical protein